MDTNNFNIDNLNGLIDPKRKHLYASIVNAGKVLNNLKKLYKQLLKAITT